MVKTGTTETTHKKVLKCNSHNSMKKRYMILCVCAAQLCPAPLDPMDPMEPARLLCPQNFPGKNTAVVVIFYSRGSPWPGIKPTSPVSPALAAGFFTTAPPRKPDTVVLWEQQRGSMPEMESGSLPREVSISLRSEYAHSGRWLCPEWLLSSCLHLTALLRPFHPPSHLPVTFSWNPDLSTWSDLILL